MPTESTLRMIPVSMDLDEDGEVGQDFKDYFLAIYSYPDYVATQPELSFQRHLLNVMHREVRQDRKSL